MKQYNGISPSKHSSAIVNSSSSARLISNRTSMYVPNAEPDLKSEMRTLRSMFYQLESKVNSLNEYVLKLQSEITNQLEQVKKREEKITELQYQVQTLEKSIQDDKRKSKYDQTFNTSKIYEMKVELETKCISIDEKIKMVQQVLDQKLQKYTLNNETIQAQIDNLSKKRIKIDLQLNDNSTRQIQELINRFNTQSDLSFDQMYQLDDQGYLTDANNQYILDDQGACIKLSEKQIQYLTQQFYK